MTPFKFTQIAQLNRTELEPLLHESREQGFKFLDTLLNEYVGGTNRFELPGEALFGIYEEGRLLAIGGLNRDPFLDDPHVGRVRHVYVLGAYRRHGLGRFLMQGIIEAARPSYQLLTLRTFIEPAASFYQALGFRTEPAIPEATHHMQLSTAVYYPSIVRVDQ